MGAISVDRLSKTFRAKTRPEGLAASLRSVVAPSYREVEAVRGVSFEVDEVTASQEVRGRFVAHGPPGFLPVFRQRGVTVDPAIFQAG